MHFFPRSLFFLFFLLLTIMAHGPCYYLNQPPPDRDNDGLADSVDNCPDMANSDQADNDHDGAGNACDPDDDNDGIPDQFDNCPLNPTLDQQDSDQDGSGDFCDPDFDNDGILNIQDNCPLTANVDQKNFDGDSFGDACDGDRDNDGIINQSDNCPGVPNPGQQDQDLDWTGDACDPCPTTDEDDRDFDGDGRGNACDDDDDNDGLADVVDNCPRQVNPDQANQDGDPFGDACDGCPQRPTQANSDRDEDGRGDECDNCPQAYNPDQLDRDGDGSGDVCTWQRVVIADSDRLGAVSSMVAGQDGRIHLVYSQKQLYYAIWDGTAWQRSVVAHNGFLDNRLTIALALDANDSPHLLYYDDATATLNYTMLTSDGWQNQVLLENCREMALALQIDREGNPHIVYFQQGNNAELIYLRWQPDGWQREVIGHYDSLWNLHFAFTTAGQPQIIYGACNDCALFYAFRDEGQWHIEQIDAGGSDFGAAFDGDGAPYLALPASYDGVSVVTVRQRQEGQWQEHRIADLAANTQIDALEIAFDAANQPHFIYQARTNGNCHWLEYLRLSDEIPQRSAITPVSCDDSSDIRYYYYDPTLLLDRSGQPHFSFRQYWWDESRAVDYYGLFHTTLNSAASWQSEEIARIDYAPASLSLVLTQDDFPRLSYVQSGSLWFSQPTTTGWQRQAVEQDDIVNRIHDLVLDQAGQPHIGYFNHTRGELRYASYNGQEWQRETVMVNSAISWLKLALDSQDQPHFLFLVALDNYSCALHYTWRAEGSWHDSLLTSRASNSDIDLVMDQTDRPHILFRENSQIFYGLADATGGWQMETVAVISGWIWDVSLALDHDQQPHLIFFSDQGHYRDDMDLHYFHRTSRGWQESVDFFIGRVAGTLRLDRAERPYVFSYPREYGGNLQYQYLDGQEWRRMILTEEFEMPNSGAQFVLDSRDTPHLAYYDTEMNEIYYQTWK
jgi:hypothetical protein